MFSHTSSAKERLCQTSMDDLGETRLRLKCFERIPHQRSIAIPELGLETSTVRRFSARSVPVGQRLTNVSCQSTPHRGTYRSAADLPQNAAMSTGPRSQVDSFSITNGLQFLHSRHATYSHRVGAQREKGVSDKLSGNFSS